MNGLFVVFFIYSKHLAYQPDRFLLLPPNNTHAERACQHICFCRGTKIYNFFVSSSKLTFLSLAATFKWCLHIKFWLCLHCHGLKMTSDHSENWSKILFFSSLHWEGAFLLITYHKLPSPLLHRYSMWYIMNVATSDKSGLTSEIYWGWVHKKRRWTLASLFLSFQILIDTLLRIYADNWCLMVWALFSYSYQSPTFNINTIPFVSQFEWITIQVFFYRAGDVTSRLKSLMLRLEVKKLDYKADCVPGIDFLLFVPVPIPVTLV